MIVALRILESLPVLDWVGFHGVPLGRSRFGPLHGWCCDRLGDLSLAYAGRVLLLQNLASGICLWRTGLFGASVIMHSFHVVKEVPSPGKSISRNGPFTSFENAQVWVVSMTVESMCFTFVTEKTSIGREVQICVGTGWNFTPIWFQVGIQIFAISLLVSRSLGI